MTKANTIAKIDDLINFLEKAGLYDDDLQAEYDFMDALDFEEAMVCSFLEDVENVVNSILDRDGHVVDAIFLQLSKIRGEI